jgi:phage shock protein A
MINETLLNRIRRLVAGSANQLVDAVENAAPETVMSEAIREIGTAIEQSRDELGKVIANRHLANKRLMEANRKHEELSGKIELAVTQGRDDLAEAAISRQLDLEAQMPVLEGAISDTSGEQQEIEGYVAALLARQREMEEELDLFKQVQKSRASNGANGEPGATPDMQNKVSQAESAFNRAMKSSTGLDGTGEGSNPADATKLAELEKLARDNRVSERLSAIKAGKQKDTG